MRYGRTPDISKFLYFRFWQRVYYLRSEEKFPNSDERSAYWLGVSHHVGDDLTFKLMDAKTCKIVHRSVVRPATDASKPNFQAEFPALDQDTPTLLDDDVFMDAEDGGDQGPVVTDVVPNDDPDGIPGADVDGFPFPGNETPTPARNTDPTPGEVLTRKVRMPIPGRTNKHKRTKKVTFTVPLDTSSVPPLSRTDTMPYVRPSATTAPKPADSGEDAITADAGETASEPETGEVTIDQPQASGDDPTLRRSRRIKEQNITHALAKRVSTAPLWFRHAKRWLPTLIWLGGTALAIGEYASPTLGRMPWSSTTPDDVGGFDFDIPESNANMEQLRYVQACDQWADEHAEACYNDRMCTPLRILKHKIARKARYDYTDKFNRSDHMRVLVQFVNGSRAWVQATAVQLDDPCLLIEYVAREKLHKEPAFHWVKDYVKEPDKVTRLVKAYAAKTRSDGRRYKFGIEVPRTPRHALLLDKQNKDTMWRESMDKEISQINDYKTFRVVPDDYVMPPEYQRIPYHMVFDVKFDLRRKSRLVAGGESHGTVARGHLFRRCWH